MDQKPLDNLVALLDLEELDKNIFRGRSPDERRQRVFGGQVAGQALVAAGRTVEGRVVHSLHAYFLRPGNPTIPILYEVDRIRDGKSFATRRVVAIQRGEAIFHLSASFQVAEDGLEYQMEFPKDAPDPDSLPTFEERLDGMFAKMDPDKIHPDLLSWRKRERPIDVRVAHPQSFTKPEKRIPPRQYVWIRARGTLPDLPLLHHCIVAYASDMTLLDTAMLPHAMPLAWLDPRFQAASLDHAMWFHRTFRADEWILYSQESPSSSQARGLATGNLFTRDGRLVVSVVQEGLIRAPMPRK